MATKKDYKAIFAQRLVDEFISKITGEKVERISGNEPENMFMVGKLSCGSEKQNENSSTVLINQLGVDFYIKKEDIDTAVLEIIPKGEFYYRVLPTLEEQRKVLFGKFDIIDGKEYKTFEEIEKAFYQKTQNNNLTKAKTNLDKNRLALAFEKISIQKENYKIKINLQDIIDSKVQAGRYSCKQKLRLALDQDIHHIWMKSNTYKTIREQIRLSDLKDEASLSDFFRRNSDKETPKPSWELDIQINIKLVKGDRYRISVDLVNDTQHTELRAYKQKAYSDVLFNSGLDIKLINAEFLDIELNYFANDYKYNKTEKAVGNNCSVIFNEYENKISTTNIPIYFQYRLKTRTDLIAKFDDLINKPFETLENIYQEMLKEKGTWERDFNARFHQLGQAKDQYRQEIKEFENELKRFKYGIEQLKREAVRKAFVYMNQAFKNSNKKYDSWRLFQIIFIVSLIPDIIVSEYGEKEISRSFIDKVDLLYFPTGGGKTEAFFGITVFTLFFDRLRGKKSGVSTIIKYPLRLLSVQQVDRLTRILASAELIRNNESNLSGDRFALGYLVGENNTPNRLSSEKIVAIKLKDQEQLNEKYRIIDICPFCKNSTVNVVFDEENLRLKHECNNVQCSSGGDLPIYIVDTEIYRYLPSVIISTIDKIASIGSQANFRNILGEVSHFCPTHGFTSRISCTEKDCKINFEEFEKVTLVDPAPTLLIQDEVHLIRESLGTFDAHYETLFQHLIKELTSSRKKLKIIGATATISDFQNQIKHLYNKQAVRFPCESPDIKKNFYSYVDENELHRIVLGYAPYGKAIINSVVYSMKYFRDVVWEYYNDLEKLKNIPGMKGVTDEEALEILKDYWIFIQYNTVKLEGNKIVSALSDPINTQLKKEGKKEFEVRVMTGDDTFQTVRKTLFEVETTRTRDVFNGLNLIVATSMISHGVDADKFNVMFFYGMPGNTAEYIQAYSRVGRKYPGIVIDIIRPSREKDQSYLKNFVKFHDYKDILVEPVPINRWASRAINRTFSGILSAILLSYYDLKLQYQYGNIYNMSVLKKVIEENKIDLEELKEHIINAYGCKSENNLNKLAMQYYQFIIEKIDHIFAEITTRSFNNEYVFLGQGIPLLDSDLHKPMISLRDTDKSVQIELG